MKKMYLSLVFLILGSMATLCSQTGGIPLIRMPRRSYGPVEYTCHITGLSQAASRTFYVVRTYGSSDSSSFTCFRVEGDSVSLRDLRYSPGTTTAREYLSWDPLLAKLESGREYFSRELKPPVPVIGGTRFYLPLGSPFSERMSIFRIDDHYRLEPNKAPTPEPDLRLNLTRREYQTDGFLITVDQDFNKVPQFVYTMIRDRLLSGRQLKAEHLKAVMAYAAGQTGHQVEVLDPAYADYMGTKPVNRYRDLFSLNKKYLGLVYGPILLFCIVIEFILLLILLKPISGKRLQGWGDWGVAAGACLIGNAVTVSLGWWALPPLIINTAFYIAAVALISLAVETQLLAAMLRLWRRQALLICLAGNLVTLGTVIGFFAWV